MAGSLFSRFKEILILKAYNGCMKTATKMSVLQHRRETDEELVALVLKDPNVYLRLMERYEKKLLSYVVRISGISQDEARDVVQESFIKAYKNLEGFDKSLKFSSWIYRIAKNEAISAYRKNKIRPKPLGIGREKMAERLLADSDLENDMDKNFLNKYVQDILDKIDKKYKEVLVLNFWEGYGYKEISNILKKPIGTVGTLINRAKKSFKEQYTKLGKKFF